jgi:hypothetical protein
MPLQGLFAEDCGNCNEMVILGGFGSIWVLWTAVPMPNKCLPVNARQTHWLLRQEKVSPNAEKARFQAISVNIGESWAECC